MFLTKFLLASPNFPNLPCPKTIQGAPLKLASMHWLIYFAGCVRIMVENSGLVPWSQCAFEEIQKIIIDKKISMNVCFLKFTLLELLMGFVDDLVEQWVKNLIQLVSLMILFIRAEREGGFSLHLYVCSELLPCFFAAGNTN